MSDVLGPEELEARLNAIGDERYHDKHPFHKLLHGGKATKGQVQAWVLNRYCYQRAIPRKDAALISKMMDSALRREWRSRIEDHDGRKPGDGGEAYVRFVAEHSLLDAVASSLTELFAPAIHRERIAGFLEHYDFANETTLSYFNKRLDEAPKDVKFGLDYILREAKTAEQQQGVIAALYFKTDVLWAQLDALHHAYVTPGHIPPGAFRPEDA